MLVIVLVSLLGAASSQATLAARSSSRVFERQLAAPKGFVNTNATNATADYFALTQDGRLERIQLVFPEETQVLISFLLPSDFTKLIALVCKMGKFFYNFL